MSYLEKVRKILRDQAGDYWDDNEVLSEIEFAKYFVASQTRPKIIEAQASAVDFQKGVYKVDRDDVVEVLQVVVKNILLRKVNPSEPVRLHLAFCPQVWWQLGHDQFKVFPVGEFCRVLLTADYIPSEIDGVLMMDDGLAVIIEDSGIDIKPDNVWSGAIDELIEDDTVKLDCRVSVVPAETENVLFDTAVVWLAVSNLLQYDASTENLQKSTLFFKKAQAVMQEMKNKTADSNLIDRPLAWE